MGQNQEKGEMETKISEDEGDEDVEEEIEEEEGIRPILKKRTRLSLSESGSQTEITALDDQRQERHQDERYQSAPILSKLDEADNNGGVNIRDGGLTNTIRRSHSVSFALPTRLSTTPVSGKSSPT